MIKRIIICILSVIISSTLVVSQTKKYYVSLSGNDANSGSIESPFRTISKVTGLMYGGDTCFVKAGYYRESVTPLRSGTSGHPIVFSAYNTDTVIITGNDAVTGWQSYKGNIYKAYSPGIVTQVFIDGHQANKATYPNINNFSFTKTGWATANVASTGVVTFTGANFPTNYWNGATFIGLAGLKWVMLSGTITANNATTVTCTYPSQQSAQWTSTNYNGSGVGYITNHLNAVDIAGEWHWQNDTLYVCLPSGSTANNYVIEARKRQNGFIGDNLSYLSVKNINFFASSLSFKSSQNCVVDGGTVRYPCPFYVHTSNWARSSTYSDSWEGKGVYLSGSNNTIKNMCVTNSFGDGISIGGTNNTVTNCMVDSCDYAAIDLAPISMVGTSHSIDHCTVNASGRSGLLHRKSKQCNIKYNDIGFAGKMTADLGITYTYGSNGQGSEIAYNWIHDNKESGSYSMGVYLDNGDTSFVVHHNVIWNCGYSAIHMNYPAVNHQLYNNTVWNCAYATVTGTGTGGHSGIIVKNNLSNKTWLYIYDIQSNNLTSSTPGFSNVSANDYSLTSSSLAIDYGATLSPFTDNFVGVAPDAGAYEYGAPKWIPGATGISKLNFKMTSSKNDYCSVGNGATVDLSLAANWLYFDGLFWQPAIQAPCATGTQKVGSGNIITIKAGDTWDNTTAATTAVPGGVVFVHMGNTGNNFSTTNKVWFYSPTKVVFKSTLPTDTITIPYAVYAGIDIPTGSNAKYLNSTALQIGAQTSEGLLNVNGSLRLGRVNSVNCGAVKIYSQATGTQSAVSGNGTINVQSANRLQFGLNNGGQPILFNFTGTFASTGQGINVYNEGVLLQTDFTNYGMTYFGNATSFIDLNGYTFSTGTITGANTNLPFKNTLSGSLVVTGNANAIGSMDGLPFKNITLGSGINKYTISSDLTVKNLFTCLAGDTLTATSTRIIHVPNNNPVVTPTLSNVIIVKDLPAGISAKVDEKFDVYPTISSDNINIKFPTNDVYRIKLYDMSGKMVKSIDARESAVISVSDLSGGVYFLLVVGGNKQIQRKIIVN